MTTKQAQQTSNSTVTGPQSLVLLKNMLRLSVSSICYMRGIFPPECFSSKDYAGLKVHQLECAEKSDSGDVQIKFPEAFLLSQWLERGVFEALEKKYLKSLSFAIIVKHPHTGIDTLLESYQFLVDYPEGSCTTLNGVPTTKENLKKQAVTFIRCLVEFSGTLEELPEDRWLSMKLLYYDDKTPADFEPEYFQSADANIFKFLGDPLKIKVGKLETPFHTLQLKFTGMDLETLLTENNGGINSKDFAQIRQIQQSFHSISVHDSTGKCKTDGDEANAQKKAIEDYSKVAETHTPANLNDHLDDEISIDEKIIDGNQKTDMVAKGSAADHIYDRVRNYILTQGKASVQDCAAQLQIKHNLVREAFARMVADGIIKGKGKGFIIDDIGSLKSIAAKDLATLGDSNKNNPVSKLIEGKEIGDGCLDDFTPTGVASTVQKHAPPVPKKTMQDSGKPRTALAVQLFDDNKVPEGGSKRAADLSQDSSYVVGEKCSIIRDPLHQAQEKRRKLF